MKGVKFQVENQMRIAVVGVGAVGGYFGGRLAVAGEDVAFKAAPGRIKHLGVEPFIAVGELDNHSSERVAGLVRTFKDAGIAAGNPPDIHSSIWRKFLFVTPVGGIGAITRSPIGVVRSLPETREMLLTGMREICAVARARGINLPPDAVEKTMAFLDGMPEDATSSMQRDIMEGRPSELESQNGAVVRIGRNVGVETPLHQFVYSSLLPMEISARGRSAAL